MTPHPYTWSPPVASHTMLQLRPSTCLHPHLIPQAPHQCQKPLQAALAKARGWSAHRAPPTASPSQGTAAGSQKAVPAPPPASLQGRSWSLSPLLPAAHRQASTTSCSTGWGCRQDPFQGRVMARAAGAVRMLQHHSCRGAKEGTLPRPPAPTAAQPATQKGSNKENLQGPPAPAPAWSVTENGSKAVLGGCRCKMLTGCLPVHKACPKWSSMQQSTSPTASAQPPRSAPCRIWRQSTPLS